MIIVPTEKRFDWQNAPIALFVIVILNVLVFYVYQTGDSDHFDEALSIYVSDGIYQQEAPHYQDFLKQSVDAEKVALFKELEQYPNSDYAAAFILQDELFYAYMLENGAEFFTPEYHDYWQFQREHIHDLMFEVSYKKHGLIANDIHVTALITHQFLHAGTMHLIGNMFFLIICGFAVEASLGHKKFLLFYLLTGVGGGLAQALMDLDSGTPLIGAPALFILPFYIGNELISLWTQPEANVAFMAHVGGFVTGAVLIGLVVWHKPETLNQEYIEQDQAATPIQLSLDKVYQRMDKYQFESAAKLLDEHMTEFGSDFNLKLLKYKLLLADKPEQAQNYFNQIINVTRPNKRQLAKLEKIWQGLSKADKQLEPESQYKLAWSFINVPEHIEHAVYLFQQLYQAENKHPSLNLLAKKISFAYKGLENRAETEKYLAIAQELS